MIMYSEAEKTDESDTPPVKTVSPQTQEFLLWLHFLQNSNIVGLHITNVNDTLHTLFTVTFYNSA